MSLRIHNRVVSEVWFEVGCDHPTCRNTGPYLVYGPAGMERYHCALCGDEMWRREVR